MNNVLLARRTPPLLLLSKQKQDGFQTNLIPQLALPRTSSPLSRLSHSATSCMRYLKKISICLSLASLMPLHLKILYEMESQMKKGKEKEQAKWNNPTIDKIFIDACVKEVRGGNREGENFSRIGWKNILETFNAATEKAYKQKQLKNCLDTLRREWVLWNSLLKGETGLGWDPVRKTVDATPDWWEKKLELYPKAAKFRAMGLEHAFELDEIFHDVTATGDRDCALTFGSLPPLYQNANFGGDNSVSKSNNDSEGDNLQHASPIDNISINLTTEVEQKKMRNPNKRAENVTAASKLSKQLDRIFDAIQSMTSTLMTPYRTDMPGCSIQEVIEYMAMMPECPKRSPLFMFGIRLFKKRENREIFVALGDDETRLQWLKEEKFESQTASGNYFGS